MYISTWSATCFATSWFPSLTDVKVPLRSEVIDTTPYTTSGRTAAVAIISTKREVMRFTARPALRTPAATATRW